jgi:hypothetical protein
MESIEIFIYEESMNNFLVCKACGEYEHDCQCEGAKMIKQLELQRDEAVNKLITLQGKTGYCIQCERLQRELTQLQLENEELKAESKKQRELALDYALQVARKDAQLTSLKSIAERLFSRVYYLNNVEKWSAETGKMNKEALTAYETFTKENP